MESWEELRKLPTHARMRNTVLDNGSGEEKLHEITIDGVNFDDYVENQIFKTKDIPEDNEIFLSKIQERMDKASVETPSVEVKFENLTVKGKVRIGSAALPTLLNVVADFMESMLSYFNISFFPKKELLILDGATGDLKPGRMTLLIGPPGGGKSTLLRILSGQKDSTLQVEGHICYNGYKLDQFEPKRTASLVGQDDIHLPDLTIKETFDYSARYQGVGLEYELMTQLLRKEEELDVKPDSEIDLFMKARALENVSHFLMTKYFIKMLGLETCANTVIGDHMRRGVSGGEKKRATLGEMMVGPARVHFMDGISTGLDSSTTYQIVKCIRQRATLEQHTVLMTLLQPTPEVFELFDDVMVLWGSQIVYHGPREKVQTFFEGFGFKCPPRKATSDFLQEVTSSKDQEKYWADREQPFAFVSANQIAETYRNSELGRKMLQEVSVHEDRCASKKSALAFNKWSLPQWKLLKISFRKEILLFKKNILFEAFVLFQMASVATITGTMFFRTNLHAHNIRDAQTYGGALYILVLVLAFSGWVEILATTLRFPTFIKFRELNFFPPWTWSLAAGVVKAPYNLVQTLVFIGISYYTIGLTPEGGRFFRLVLLMTAVVVMASAFFRMIAGFSKTKAIATGLAGFGVTTFCILGGVSVPRTLLRGWWIWGYWALPISYAQNAVWVNEFMGSRWRKLRAGITRHDTVGHRFTIAQGFMDRGYRYWLGLGAIIGFALLFNLCFSLLITFQSPPKKSQPLISEEYLDEMEENRTGLRHKTSKNSAPTQGDHHSSEPEQLSSDSDLSPPRTSSTSIEKANVVTPGMRLPFVPYYITFKSINYFVDRPKNDQSLGGERGERLQLLHGITGAFQPGVLTALVGATGAGKTTLLDVLCGRKTTGYIEGDIRINGFPQKLETFTRVAAYCEQTDTHSPQVTVYESVVFSTWLRLPPGTDSQIKKDFVMEVLNLVDLASLKGALVGVPGQSGLSAEQRKRLTIAVELVANPSIIFMDEPTTGLDARSAAIVMRTVRNTVDTGRTLVCTIHQPSIEIFESFDEILLLKRGGHLVYGGALGKDSQLMIDYFQNNTAVPHIKDGQNPAAWVLDITNPGMEHKLGIDFGEIYRNSVAFKDIEHNVEQMAVPSPGAQDIAFPTKYAQPFWSQFLTCLWRQYWTYWRSPSYNVVRFGLAIGIGILFGTVHWGFGHKLDNERYIHALIGAFFFIHGFYAVITCEAMQPVIGAERQIFYRERAAGLYNPRAYALSQSAIELPYVFIASAIVHLLIYSMMKLPWEGGKFFWIFYFTFASQLTFANLGLVATAVAPNVELASILCIGLTQVCLLFTEYTMPIPKMPNWYKWLEWSNPLELSIYGPMAVLLGDKSNDFLTTADGQFMSVKHFASSRYVFKKSYLGFVGPLVAVYPILFATLYVLALTHINHQKR